ncbi:hypothetical protein [Moheibacter stercoris]|uniref:Uncharacterized protein n=1 Tax=Moheibacter stercoris TaxID=1628251 RepID=A0ABV2LVU0_9FLAO
MKKLLPFLALIFFGFSMQSCVSDDDNGSYTDYDTYSVVYEISNANFSLVNGVYQISRTFSPELYEYDMVLVYMQNGTTQNGAPIWQQIPITFYLDNGHEVDYSFDFSRYDVVITAGGTFDLGGTNYISNKRFRVLVVPADPPGRGNAEAVDYSNYQAVIDHYGINDQQVIQL